MQSDKMNLKPFQYLFAEKEQQKRIICLGIKNNKNTTLPFYVVIYQAQ